MSISKCMRTVVTERCMLDLSCNAMRCVLHASACRALPGALHREARVYAHLQNFLLSLLEEMPGLTPRSHLELQSHPHHPAPPALLRQEQYYLRRLLITGRMCLAHAVIPLYTLLVGRKGRGWRCLLQPQQQAPLIVRSACGAGYN